MGFTAFDDNLSGKALAAGLVHDVPAASALPLTKVALSSQVITIALQWLSNWPMFAL